MDTTNEKTIARSTQTQIKSVDIARRDGITGRESEYSGGQQERDAGTNSPESSIFGVGATVTGGMLDHLIDDHLDEMVAKEDEAKRIADHAKRVKADLERLKARIQELKALREELNKQSEKLE